MSCASRSWAEVRLGAVGAGLKGWMVPRRSEEEAFAGSVEDEVVLPRSAVRGVALPVSLLGASLPRLRDRSVPCCIVCAGAADFPVVADAASDSTVSASR